jgi:hypothetical protein
VLQRGFLVSLSQRRRVGDPMETSTYTVDQSQEIADLGVEQVHRNGLHPIRQCIVWSVLYGIFANNPAYDYWTMVDGNPRKDMPPEIDRLITADGTITKIRQGNSSFYVYSGKEKF